MSGVLVSSWCYRGYHDNAGLPKVPAAESIDDNTGRISGLFRFKTINIRDAEEEEMAITIENSGNEGSRREDFHGYRLRLSYSLYGRKAGIEIIWWEITDDGGSRR